MRFSLLTDKYSCGIGGRLPLPLREGWGEGLRSLDRTRTPHPNPLPFGEREQIAFAARSAYQHPEPGTVMSRIMTAGFATLGQSRGPQRDWLRYMPSVGMVLLLGYLVLLPLALTVLSSFRPGGFPLDPGFTLGNYLTAYGDPDFPLLLGNTLLFALGASAFALVLGIGLAWLVERSDLPGREMLRGLVLLPMATPPILLAIAWAMLLSPRNGVLNQFLMQSLGLERDAAQHLHAARHDLRAGAGAGADGVSVPVAGLRQHGPVARRSGNGLRRRHLGADPARDAADSLAADPLGRDLPADRFAGGVRRAGHTRYARPRLCPELADLLSGRPQPGRGTALWPGQRARHAVPRHPARPGLCLSSPDAPRRTLSHHHRQGIPAAHLSARPRAAVGACRAHGSISCSASSRRC